MQLYKYPSRVEYAEIVKRASVDYTSIKEIVAEIIADVKANGDTAIRTYAEKFDKVVITDIEISRKQLIDLSAGLDIGLKNAINQAIKNISTFHAAQKEQFRPIETTPGVTCWRNSLPIQKVGLYIPGGSAPLFSTLLMLATPAKLAGCKDVIVCTPPNKDNKIHPAIAYAALQVGVDKVFAVGGAQAVAAMAFGTNTIPKVDKIFGPGNNYVTVAKILLAAEGVAIDLPAGPSELAIIADVSCNAAFVAADLLSQLEHGPDSQVLLITDSEQVLDDVLTQVCIQIETLPRKDIVLQSLKNSKTILVNTLEEGMELANEYAPEHLIIACKKDERLASMVVNAGSVFLGNYSPESAGDYASGTNHTLPTNGYAKAFSGVSLDSFMKKITFQKITREGLDSIANTIETMAIAEGLQAHANAITIRIKETK